ncbi:type II toxin-antitoxin system ParD family antitoxin [Dietzia maris]
MTPSTDRPNDLRRALIAGEESGAPEEFDFDAFIAAKRS